MEQTAFNSRILDFLKEDNPGFEGEVGTDDNLFNLGLLESFSIPRLILFLEELRGSPLPLERSTIESFFTMGSIYRLSVPEAGKSRDGA